MRKKLFAVIMSVMMMVTFMPTMAFAATTVEWDTDNYSWVKVDGEKYDTVKYINVTSTGGNNYTWTDGKVQVMGKGPAAAQTTSYYDLSVAAVSKTGHDAWGSKSTWKFSEAESRLGALDNLESELAVTELSFSLPNVAYKKVGTDAVSAIAGIDYIGAASTLVTSSIAANYKFVVNAPNYDADKRYTDNISYTATATKNLQVAEPTVNVVGDIPSKSITIQKDTAGAAQAEYTLDGEVATTVGDNEVLYTAGDHTFTQKTISGVTSTYKLLKDGKWETISGDAVVLKDVGTYTIKATAKDADDTIVKDFIVKVVNDYKAFVGFKQYSFKVGTKNFKPEKYTKVDFDYVGAGTADVKGYRAITKAVKADEKLIKEFFNDFYDINVEQSNVSVNEYSALIENKESLAKLSAADKDVLINKYSVLVKNYGYTPLTRANLATTDAFTSVPYASFQVIDDIEFTTAPLTKAYKAKKGKLPKNKTFKIKAKSEAGATVVYKIKSGAGKIKINRNTGKVTVKKGLKKGTYKVTVYAIDVDTWGEVDSNGNSIELENHYTLKVKVK